MSQFYLNNNKSIKPKNETFNENYIKSQNYRTLLQKRQSFHQNNNRIKKNEFKSCDEEEGYAQFTPMTFYRNGEQKSDLRHQNDLQKQKYFHKKNKRYQNFQNLLTYNQSKKTFQNVSQLDKSLEQMYENRQNQAEDSNQQKTLQHQHEMPYNNLQRQNFSNSHNNQRQNATYCDKNSRSKHPIFYSYQQLQQNYTQYHPTQSDQSSPYSSSKKVRTILNESQIKSKKYLKYKRKYLQALQAIEKLQKLNQTLINDQRKNYNILQNTINQLESIIQQKQQDIYRLNQIISQIQEKMLSFQQNHFQLSKEEYETILKENISMKVKIDQLTATAQEIGRRSNLNKANSEADIKKISIQNSNVKEDQQNQLQLMNSKLVRLKKQNESLQEKMKQIQQTNKLYENMLKQKQKRINKLSQFNTSLSLQILKLKNQFLNFASNQNYSQVSIYTSEVQQESEGYQKQQNKRGDLLDTFNPSKNNQLQVPVKRQIESYISKVDNQISLIKKKISPFKTQLAKQKKEESQNFKLLKNNLVLKRTQSHENADKQDNKNENNSVKYLNELQMMRNQLSQIKKEVYGESTSLSTNSK